MVGLHPEAWLSSSRLMKVSWSCLPMQCYLWVLLHLPTAAETTPFGYEEMFEISGINPLETSALRLLFLQEIHKVSLRCFHWV